MRLIVRLALVAFIFHASQAAAQQEVAFVERGPQFLLAANGSPERIEPTRMPLLRQRITLDLRGVSMHEAIMAISKQSGLRLMFGDNILPHDRTVTLRAEAITVAAALTEVLLDAEVDVLFSRSGNAALVRRSASGAMLMGTIAGRVTDATTQQGIEGVRVFLEGTRLSTATGSTGSYRLTAVPAGAYTLVIRRLGYKASEQAVTVEDGREVTVDVTLQPAPSALDQVVVTVTGEQRLRELGHVVGRINADSVVKAAPVSSLSELLTGRVVGLQVSQAQGIVGGEVSLRIRGPNTIQLSTEPIVIVDGVRYTSRHANRKFSFISDAEPTSPLNDLNPNEIESIDVVKGPSAATLYGTDAANGVIIVTTKRGRPGSARWGSYVKGATTAIPDTQHDDNYWGWSSAFGDFGWIVQCHLGFVAQGVCGQDSVTVIPNPLNDPQRTIFQSKPRWEYGANVSGGSQTVRYFFAGDFEQATGPLRMPPRIADSLALVRGKPLSKEQLEPNGFSKINLRSNITAALGKTAELRVNAGYGQRSTRTVSSFALNPYSSGSFNVMPGNPYGLNPPEESFARTSEEDVRRSFIMASGLWAPAIWLQLRATGGVDLTSSARASVAPPSDPRPPGAFGPADVINRWFSTGAVGDDRARQLATSSEVAATASFSSARLTSRTSVGAQYVRTVDNVLASVGTDLPPGGSSIGQATTVQAAQTYSEQVTLGSYFEQSIGLNQRLFLTGALRADGASTFGRDYRAVVYPKAGVSWLVSEEPVLQRLPGLDELRLRYGFGASGQQPRPEWARPAYSLQQIWYNGGIANVFAVSGLGNPNLRPERVREHEFGFDASALANRMTLAVTWYRRSTVDQIVSVNLPPSLGTMQSNLGHITGRGFEAEISGRLVDSRALSWYVALQHSFHRSTLRELGGAAAFRDPLGGWVEGYPIGARFMRPLLGYSDVNGDGIITTAEIQLGDTAIYVGESRPPRSQTGTTSLGLFNQRLRLSALVERRSGFTQVDDIATLRCRTFTCRAAVVRDAPLADQAAAAAISQTDYVLIEPGDFTRLREVSIAADLPANLVRALRLGTATLSLQGRNLALWTSYSGTDPESASQVSPLLSTTAMEIGIPQNRTWSLRFDVGF